MSSARILNEASLMYGEWAAVSRGSTWVPMRVCLRHRRFVQTLEKRQGLRIACPEEIAYIQGFITRDEFVKLGRRFEKSTYGQYLLKVADETV